MARKLQIWVTLCLLLAAAFVGWRRMSATANANLSCDAECRVSRALMLSDAQAARLRQIVAARQTQVKNILRHFEPRMDEGRERARRQLAEILTAQQQQRFDAFLNEMRSRHQSRLTAKALLLPHCKHAPKGAGIHHYGQAASSHTGKDRHRQGRIDKLMARLELETTQIERVRKILGNLHDAIKPLKWELKGQVAGLQTEVATDLEGELSPAQIEVWKQLLATPEVLCEPEEMP